MSTVAPPTSAAHAREAIGEDLYTAAQVLDLLVAAYERGRFDGDIHELRATWADRQEPALTREQRVAIRLASYADAAEQINERLGRHPRYRYRGGAVDWETGMPWPSGCAWLARKRTSRRDFGRAA